MSRAPSPPFNPVQQQPRWMAPLLLIAGLYNLLWGAWVILFPQTIFDWAGMEQPRYPAIWQCLGMVIGVYGIGYLIAARDVARHWPIVLVGLLGKIFGPIGFLWTAMHGDIAWQWGWMMLPNDLVWWVPFSLILWHAVRANTAPVDPAALPGASSEEIERSQNPLQTLLTTTGVTLDALSRQRTMLVACLRHSGCVFCRRAIADLGRQRKEIEAAGVGIAIVHMGDDAKMAELCENHGLGDIPRLVDPAARVYRYLGVPRGSFWQVLGPRTWLRGFKEAIIGGHGFGPVVGDALQLAGTFLLQDGRVIAAHKDRAASDRPNFVQIAIGKQ